MGVLVAAAPCVTTTIVGAAEVVATAADAAAATSTSTPAAAVPHCRTLTMAGWRKRGGRGERDRGGYVAGKELQSAAGRQKGRCVCGESALGWPRQSAQVPV